MKTAARLSMGMFALVLFSLANLAGGCSSSNTGSGRSGAGGAATGGHPAGAGGIATGGRAAGGASAAAGAAGAASGGRAGAGGAAGAAGARGAAGAGAGGAQADCHQVQCLRAYQCVTTCGATPQSVGCCPCVAPAFDEVSGCGGAGGTAGPTYVGCHFIGGVDRYVVDKRDDARNRCFGLVLDAPGQSPVSFLTLPSGIGLVGISVGPAASCPSRALSPLGPATVSGTVTQVAGAQGGPTALDVHVTVNFTSDAGQPASEDLIAASVDVTPACP